MSDFDRVKEAVSLKEYAEANLDHVSDGLVCPNCKSGTGKNKTAAFSTKGEKWKCFACDAGGDVYDLAGLIHNTTDKRDQLHLVADWAGVSLDDDSEWYMRGWNEAKGDAGGGSGSAQNARSESETATEARKEEKGTNTPENDYTAGRERHRRYVAECAERLSSGYLNYLNDGAENGAFNAVMDYLYSRGIEPDEAISLGIGYDPKPAHGWKDEAGAWHNTPRLVLPWLGSDYYHIDRAIDERAHDLKYDKPPSDPNEEKGITADMCVGAQPLYNPEAFTQDYVIAVEGVLDAIALQLSGFNAIALGGTAVNDFANEAAARKYGGVVIDMLDADGTSDPKAKNRKGRGAGADLVSLLGEAGITVLDRAEYGVEENKLYGEAGTVCAGYKDAGEWYAKEPQYLKDFMSYAVKAARDKAQRASDAEYREALRNLSVKDPASVARDVLELRGVYDPVPTGINALDNALGGGVSLGELTIFGAISSYGKTTLAVQIADYIAAAGYPVLFATIEQSAKELVAKSLSRLVYTENRSGWNIATPSEITSLQTRKLWKDGQNATLKRAVEDYKRMIAPNLRILEGNKQPTVNDVRAIAEKMAEHDGRAPIIFIDYLQLLAPISDRYDTDKRNTDVNVTELRKMARDLNTHIWAISSLNRESYTNGITMTAFKESGSLEFGSDNLMGIQVRGLYAVLEKAKGTETKIKREIEQLYQQNKRSKDRETELVILKQRNGALPDSPLPLTFKTMAAYFMEP